MTKITKKNGLAPLMCDNPTILILGSLPGDMSIAAGEYYANPRNLFWQIIAGVFSSPVPNDYTSKKQLLASKGVCLWDVYSAAERDGSLDSNIEDSTFNDIIGLLKDNPSISVVVTNGGEAKKALRKYLRIHAWEIPHKMGFTILNFTSTSALARTAGWTLDRLIEQWSAIRQEQ